MGTQIFVTYVVSGDFGKDKQAYFDNYISSTTQPLIYSLIIIAIIAFPFFGITNIVEKASKVIMPMLAVLLLVCGIYALIVVAGSCGWIEILFCAGFQ